MSFVLFVSAAAMEITTADRQRAGDMAMELRGRQLTDCVTKGASSADNPSSEASAVARMALNACSKERQAAIDVAVGVRKFIYGDADAAARIWARQYEDSFDKLVVDHVAKLLMDRRATNHAGN